MKLSTPDLDQIDMDEIDRDLTRTFPLEMFFTEHIDKIHNVLLWYAWTNPSVPYCQSFSFLAFVVYRRFYENDKRHAMIDTYYSIHKLILLIKPLLPKSSTDYGPLMFTTTLQGVLLLDIMKHDRALYARLKGSEIPKFIILSGFTSFYLNWFDSTEGIALLDYLIDKKASTMFQRLINFTVAFFLVQKSVLMTFNEEKCLELLREKHMLHFYSILWRAKSLS